MTLGETILSRRKALSLTQEQVAGRLGVTPQAVYKWEKGIACPDVQLLPPLARLLETDLNTLFAYNTEPDKVELSALIERVSRLALQKDGQPAAFAEAHAALRKYPASAQLRLSMAIVLEGALAARGGGDEERQREVEEMYRFATSSEDARVRDAARSIRVRRLIQKGKLDEAEALLDALPDPPAQKWHYRAQLLKARGEVDAAAALVEERIFGESSGLCTALSMLLDKAMAALETIAKAVQGPWMPGKHPLYRHVHFEENGSEWLNKMPEALRTSVWSDGHYAFLREDPRCAARLQELFGAPEGQT